MDRYLCVSKVWQNRAVNWAVRPCEPRLCVSWPLFLEGKRQRSRLDLYPPPKAGYTVSMRDLQIPSKARSNFERGLNRLDKCDAEGSLRFFAAAIEAAPDFYEAYYHQGVAEAQMNRNDDALQILPGSD